MSDIRWDEDMMSFSRGLSDLGTEGVGNTNDWEQILRDARLAQKNRDVQLETVSSQ